MLKGQSPCYPQKTRAACQSRRKGNSDSDQREGQHSRVYPDKVYPARSARLARSEPVRQDSPQFFGRPPDGWFPAGRAAGRFCADGLCWGAGLLCAGLCCGAGLLCAGFCWGAGRLCAGRVGEVGRVCGAGLVGVGRDTFGLVELPALGRLLGEPGRAGWFPFPGLFPGLPVPGRFPGVPGLFPPGVPGRFPGVPGLLPPGVPGRFPGVPGRFPGVPGRLPPGVPGRFPGEPGRFPGRLPGRFPGRLPGRL